MPRQARQFAESEIYHVMLRGVNRDAIFLEDADCERFLDLLRRVKEDSGCLVLAYCLMTNHIHLVLRTTTEPISLVMKRLGVRYVGWFNRKYARVGHLFQSRFASLPVEDDAYLITLLRYVWHNPVEAGLASRAEDYPWSSRNTHIRTSLVDVEVLQRLVPFEVLSGPVVRPEPPFQDRLAPIGRPPLHTHQQVAMLLRRSCGAGDRDEFGSLAVDVQRRAIRELRTRSVPYAQIAAVTGWSVKQVRRLQVAGMPPT